MNLVVTVDTEEDNWADYKVSGQTVENVRRLPKLQRLFDDFGVIPTYLVTYSVATDEAASSILRQILASGRGEIGAHCHPWNTPPVAADRVLRQYSMLCNLPSEAQQAKIKQLHECLQRAFDTQPVSFRCGRWGFHADVARHLIDSGYRIDTSVTPYMDWTPNQGPDFSATPPWPFRLASNSSGAAGTRQLLEVPVTIGFLQSCFTLSNAILRSVSRPPVKRLRLAGILDRLKLVTKVWLSPEISTAGQMIALTKRMFQQNCQILNLTFHSPSLEAGLTPFVRSRSDEDRLADRLREYLTFVRDAGIKPVPLSETLNLV